MLMFSLAVYVELLLMLFAPLVAIAVICQHLRHCVVHSIGDGEDATAAAPRLGER